MAEKNRKGRPVAGLFPFRRQQPRSCEARQLPLGEPIEYLITLPRTPGARKDVRLRCVGKVLREDAESAFAASLERYEFLRDTA